ncbi:MAG TPA: RNA methyltransferase [Coxiellaceae bacterium]|nr:RNA methyltransferase [Coxiellaceae bacterium]
MNKDSHIISILTPYITDARKKRIESVIAARIKTVQLAIESPSDINNALATVRTAEALGLSDVHIIAPKQSAGTAHAITQGAFYWVNIHFHEQLSDFLHKIQSDDFKLAGGCLHENRSIPVEEISLHHPICLMMGNEQTGLSSEAIRACDYLFHIPMVGMSESLNLSVSSAISLYITLNRKRAHLNHSSDFTPAEQQSLRAHFYLNSVSSRLARGLLGSI